MVYCRFQLNFCNSESYLTKTESTGELLSIIHCHVILKIAFNEAISPLHVHLYTRLPVLCSQWYSSFVYLTTLQSEKQNISKSQSSEHHVIGEITVVAALISSALHMIIYHGYSLNVWE